MSSRLPSGRPAAGCLLAVLIAGSAPAAAQHPNHAQGFRPEHVFDVSGLESVNLFNGNLTLTIPIGSSYPLGPELAYSLTLTWTGNVWEWEDREDPQNAPERYLQAVPRLRSNAGLGWTLSLGRLLRPADVASPQPLPAYESPDQAIHAFHSDTPSDVERTRDSTYLRHTASASTVEHPDGTKRTFGSLGGLLELEDPYGNALSITRPFSTKYPDSGVRDWRLEDDHGRVHWVRFRPAPYYGSVVETVELEAFGTQAATYTLRYALDTFVPRACNEPPSAGDTTHVKVPLLTEVELPDGSAYRMPVSSYRLSTGTCLERTHNGHLERMEVPTGGILEWDWEVWNFPQESRHWGGVRQAGEPDGLIFTQSSGLAARRHRKRNDTLLGDWSYSHTVDAAPGANRLTESRTEVTDPLGHKTTHYFSVYHDDFDPATTEPPGWDRHEYGLPFTKRVSDGTSPGRFLSREVVGQGGATLRTVYVRYERDGASPDNPRMASQRTVYENGQRADLNLSDFDGLGHYRHLVATGNFPGVATRSTFTNWNPDGTPADGAPWLLDTYDLRQVTQGTETVTQEFAFEPDGFLRRVRTRKNTACGPEDVLVNNVRFQNAGTDPDQRGYVRLAKVYGGDGASLDCGDLDSVPLPAQDDFRTRHTYSCGVLSKTELLDPASGSLALLPLDRDIDCDTGLVSASRDTAGLETSFSYDLLGRLTSEAPGGGEAETVYIYEPESANSRAKVAIRRKAPNGTILSGGQVEFDGFGRVERELRGLPNGGQAERTSSWTARGDLFARTEWHAPNTVTGTTSFNQIDPFGRPRRIFLPDGFQIDIDYDGVGGRSIAVPVATGISPAGEPTFTTATTDETYDRFGQLLRLTEPNGTRTSYSYDAQGNLTRVEMNDLGTPTQVRSFDYDHRGFLTSETHPELGAQVLYSEYDPRGNPGRIRRGNDRTVEGGWDLRYTYDTAGRLTRIDEVHDLDGNPVTIGTEIRPWKEWQYAQGGEAEAGEWGKGKLQRAVRHNWVIPPGGTEAQEIDVDVTETYTYDGAGGRIDAVRTEIDLGSEADNTRPVFAYSLAYDPLGNVTSRTYPDCSHKFCVTKSPDRTVTHTYTEGLLTSVPLFAVSLSYHPNGLIREIDRPGSVADVQGNDPHDMARPARLRTVGASEDFDSGRFGYDGAGNVTEMGSNRFRYDLLSRVVEAEVSTVSDPCTEDVRFQFVTFSDTFTREVCGEIVAGPQVTITSDGDVTFRAGERVVLADGFEIASGGRFVAAVDPGLQGASGASDATWEGAYDLFGNLTSITTERPGDSSTTRTPTTAPATNRLLAVGTSYDVAGNLVARDGRSYRYDPFGMLRETGAYVFLYGPGDERLDTIDWTAGAQNTLWVETLTLRDLDGRPLRQLRQQGGNTDDDHWTFLRDYVWREGGLLGAFTPEGLRYFHLDHLGTPRLVTNPDGDTLAYHAYFPFGEEATSPADSLVPLQYTGHERDDLDAGGTTADLDYQHARFYSPHLGRYLSPDKITHYDALRTPQLYNRYSYVVGNPINYVDPNGLRPLRATELQFFNAFFGADFSTVDVKGGLLGGAVTGVAGKEGVTLGENVFLSPRVSQRLDRGFVTSVVALGHELTHVLQYRHLGSQRFLNAYLQNYAFNRRSGQSGAEAYQNIIQEHVAFKVESVIRNFLVDNPDVASKFVSGQTFTGSELALISSALQQALDEGELLEEGFQIIQGVLVRVEYVKE